jgi:hypothetical protein
MHWTTKTGQLNKIETKRWQRFGITQVTMESLLSNCHELFSDAEHDRVKLLNKSIIPNDWNLSHTIRELNSALTILNFGYPNDLPSPIVICKEIIQLSIEFLFGEWQYTTRWHDSGKLFDKNQARKKIEWYYPFLSGLLSSLIIDDSSSVEKITNFPDTDVMNKQDIYDVTKEDTVFIFLLASWIREGHIPKSKKLINCIIESTRRCPKFLFSCLEAIDKMDYSLFLQSMKKYLKFFYDSDTTPSNQISQAASLLYLLAMQKGLIATDFHEETISVNKNDRVNGNYPQKVSRSSWAWSPELEASLTPPKIICQKYLVDMIITPQSLNIK